MKGAGWRYNGDISYCYLLLALIVWFCTMVPVFQKTSEMSCAPDFSCQECPVEEEQVRQKAPEASIGPWPKQVKYGTVIGVWAFSNNALVHTCSYTCWGIKQCHSLLVISLEWSILLRSNQHQVISSAFGMILITISGTISQSFHNRFLPGDRWCYT